MIWNRHFLVASTIEGLILINDVRIEKSLVACNTTREPIMHCAFSCDKTYFSTCGWEVTIYKFKVKGLQPVLSKHLAFDGEK